MYISRSEIKLQGDSEPDLIARVEAAYASRLAAGGFRWAMLLRSVDDAAKFASVSMWLSPEHAQAWRDANDAPAPAHGYDVATARGSMTPAAAVAIVDWQVDASDAARFVNRWNAVYHAIEDMIGSRLLQDLEQPASYAGLHAVTDPARLTPQILGAGLTDNDGLAIEPLAFERYDVVLLTEA